MKWNCIDSSKKPIDLPEESLPKEGFDIIFEDKYNTLYAGFFIWSGDYTFLAYLDPDTTVIITEVKRWKYFNRI